MTVKGAKKQRANSSEKKVSTAEPEPPKRGGRMRRAQRSRPGEETNDKTKPSVKAPPILSEDVVVLLGEETEKKGKKWGNCAVLIRQFLFNSIYEFWDS